MISFIVKQNVYIGMYMHILWLPSYYQIGRRIPYGEGILEFELQKQTRYFSDCRHSLKPHVLSLLDSTLFEAKRPRK